MIYDVVIAGAGPVGLFLACELRLAGLTVLVLEQMNDRHTPLKAGYMGMRGLNFPSVEAFYRRGLLRAVRETAIGWMNAADNEGMKMTATDPPVSPSTPPPPRFAGHFAGLLLDFNKIDFSNEKFALGGPSASGGMISLGALEDVLAERAVELGVEVRLGAAITEFTQDADGVTVSLGEATIRTQWLVGCDGGRSTVRKHAGFEFPGTDPELTGTIALADVANPEVLQPGWNITPTGMYVNGPLPGRIGVVEFDGGTAVREGPVTIDSFQGSLRRISGTDATVSAIHVATRYTDNARQATTYRKGRVLLAGDAAHVHSPFGGQGMNLGIGDAMNLGWKLAATIKGWASEGLLDTYTDERHPIGAWALEWTRAQVAILRPEPHARAMAGIVRDLIDTRAGATYFAQKISGTWLRYNLPGDHPLIGRSAPDFEFEDGTRLGDLLHTGTGLLLDFNCSEALQVLSKEWAGRVNYVSNKAKNNLGMRALLVRPDGFIAWAADDASAIPEARGAMVRWFGSAG